MQLWGTVPYAEIRDCSVINDRGRAPLIVVPDQAHVPRQSRTGLEQGAVLNHLPTESLSAALGGSVEKRDHRISGDDSSGGFTRDLSVLPTVGSEGNVGGLAIRLRWGFTRDKCC